MKSKWDDVVVEEETEQFEKQVQQLKDWIKTSESVVVDQKFFVAHLESVLRENESLTAEVKRLKAAGRYKYFVSSGPEDKIQKVLSWLERHSRTNLRLAEEEDESLKNIQWLVQARKAQRSSYYHSGKADAYANAAKKIREVLGYAEGGAEKGQEKPEEQWIVEVKQSLGWERSANPLTKDVFTSKQAAENAILENAVRMGTPREYRATKLINGEPEKIKEVPKEQWILEFQSLNNKWFRSGDNATKGVFSSEEEALKASSKGTSRKGYRARRIA